MKKLETTDQIKYLLEMIVLLRDNLPSVLKQSFWQKQIPIKDKITYLEQLANTKKNLYQEAERTYPELKGVNYLVGSSFITYTEPPVL